MKRELTNKRMLRAKLERKNKKRLKTVVARIIQHSTKALDWMRGSISLNNPYTTAFAQPSPPPFTPEQQRAAYALRARHIAEDWSAERYALELRAIREMAPQAAPGTDADQFPKPAAE